MNIGTACRILLVGLFLYPTPLFAEVKVLPVETFIIDNAENKGWVVPENNSILLLPPIITNKWVKELPRQENLSNVQHFIAAELKKVLAVDVKMAGSINVLPNFKSKSQQIQWIAEQGKQFDARTVFYITYDILPNQAPNPVRYYSIPISINPPNPSFVSAKLILNVLIVDAELGIAVDEIEGEGMSIHLNVTDLLKSNDMYTMRNLLGDELERMTQRAASNVAFECRVKRLTILRPLIQVESIEKKTAILRIGDAMGVEEKSTFAAYKNDGGQWIPVASLTTAELSHGQVLCKIKPINKREMTEDAIVVPYNAKIAGSIREPRKRQ